MREEFTIPYYDIDLENLLSNEINIDEFLETVLFDIEGANQDMICGILASYHSSDGGAPEVDDFEINDSDTVFNYDSLKGLVILEYTVCYNYTCSDLSSQNEEYMQWDFSIDKENQTIHFIGEEQLEREPDTY